MIEIQPASAADFQQIQFIAHQTWPVAYAEILSEAQLRYMLSRFYSAEALLENSNQGHHFLLASDTGKIGGFSGYEFDYGEEANTHLHKIYVLPEMQGKNLGLELIKAVEKLAKKANQQSISLNVNRNNIAISFYEKRGFTIIKSVDIEIGNGYLMEDYVMQKIIR